MLSNLRRRLAALLDPETAANARRYRFVRDLMRDDLHHLRDFPQATAVIERMQEAIDRHFNPPSARKARWEPGLSFFRQQLRFIREDEAALGLRELRAAEAAHREALLKLANLAPPPAMVVHLDTFRRERQS